MIELRPMGDRAFLARFAGEPEARAWSALVSQRALVGVIDVVTAYANVAVIADPDRVDLDELERILAGIRADPEGKSPGRLHEIPVLYDGEDLPEVARHAGISEGDVIALHSGAEYVVQAVGFLPGFPYAGRLPEPLHGLPRRPSPRVRVPAGSVAIAGEQVGIYPAESPGGWNLLGRTPLCIVDLETGFFPIEAGDRLRFRPIDAAAFRVLYGTRT
ncbi:MAG: allophanate hydrolase subunit 1 [Isosphaeraceae bacterium]